MSAKQDKCILIIEDSEEIRASMSELLEAEGYCVLRAQNGRVALDQLAEYEKLPALILLDLMMPVMDGFEFRRIQRADSRLKDIPVLLMTARGEIDDETSALGVDGYLRKPFSDIDGILEAIRRFYS
jgi:CheY-like chemotaxis protein